MRSCQSRCCYHHNHNHHYIQEVTVSFLIFLIFFSQLFSKHLVCTCYMSGILLSYGAINMSKISTSYLLTPSISTCHYLPKSLDRTRETDLGTDSIDEPTIPYFRVPSITSDPKRTQVRLEMAGDMY